MELTIIEAIIMVAGIYADIRLGMHLFSLIGSDKEWIIEKEWKNWFITC